MAVGRSAEERWRNYPSLQARLATYGLALVFVFGASRIVDRSLLVLEKLRECGVLPPLEAGLVPLLQRNTSLFYFPALLGILMLIACSEVMTAWSRRVSWGAIWSWFGVLGVALVAFPVPGAILYMFEGFVNKGLIIFH
jgi:hypothetical protein